MLTPAKMIINRRMMAMLPKPWIIRRKTENKMFKMRTFSTIDVKDNTLPVSKLNFIIVKLSFPCAWYCEHPMLRYI